MMVFGFLEVIGDTIFFRLKVKSRSSFLRRKDIEIGENNMSLNFIIKSE